MIHQHPLLGLKPPSQLVHITMLPSLVYTRAVGHATDNKKVFDDLKEVGLWPTTKTIGKVVKISIWVGKARIFAIETTYRLINDDTRMIEAHGRKYGTKVSFEAKSDEIFVGVFGTETNDEDEPALERLGFLIFNIRSGKLHVKGPQPAQSDVPMGEAVKGFVTLGRIIGFSGALRSNETLASIAVYKLEHGVRSPFEDEIAPEMEVPPVHALRLQGECWLGMGPIIEWKNRYHVNDSTDI